MYQLFWRKLTIFIYKVSWDDLQEFIIFNGLAQEIGQNQWKSCRLACFFKETASKPARKKKKKTVKNFLTGEAIWVFKKQLW